MFKSYSIGMSTVLMHQFKEGDRLFIGNLYHMGHLPRHLEEAVGRPEEVPSPEARFICKNFGLKTT